jgi:hypothetical protein
MMPLQLIYDKSTSLNYSEDEIKAYAPELLSLLRGYSESYVDMLQPSFPFTCDLTLGFDLCEFSRQNADAARLFAPVCGSLLVALAINLRNTLANGDSILSLYSDDEWEKLDPKALIHWEDYFSMVTVKPVLRIQADSIEEVTAISKHVSQVILPTLKALIGRLVLTRTVETTMTRGVQSFAPDTANSWIEIDICH